MTIEQAQRTVDHWIQTIGHGYFDHLTNMAILTEEVGEVARIIARTYGKQKAKPQEAAASLADELADVMWVTICLANQSGIDLTRALEENLHKKTTRDAQRFATGD